MKSKIYVTATLVAAILAFGACKKKTTTTIDGSKVTINTSLPALSTTAVDSVRGSNAWVSANVSSEGTSAITAVGICWDVKTGATTLRPHTNEGAGTGSYQSMMTGLLPGTTYFVRAYATNATGTAYGNEVTFKTPAGWSIVSQGLGGNYISALAASGTIVFAGTGNGVYRSSDSQGTQWTQSGLSSMDVTDIAISGNNIFAATNGDGVYLSTDGGSNWTQASNGLSGNYISRLAISGSKIYAGTPGYGVFVSSDNGGTWYSSNNGLNDTQIISIAASGANVYAGTYSGGVYRSSDNGSSWTVANNGLSVSNGIYALSTSGTNVLAGTNAGMYISSNNGSNWTKISSVQSIPIICFATKANAVYAGSYGTAYVSVNNGSTFIESNAGLQNNGVQSLAVNDAFAFGTDGSRIFRYPVN